ncbi:polyhydroxybutyrate depolymerase [Palleronia salina]|uniref:Polyhydroxybutyrate depolymerase n=1 Tax=Palleronia salina TaxID=313368 RepID=A0A1M6L856_9RHOB|nr:PHB depolymerase family esterase [Palleronia salina]SHJ67418.1 polyhydroxybutyrate depolymerase [Palleronia salina]
MKKRAASSLAAALLCLAVPNAAQAACGPDPDPCAIPDGTYHVELPESPAPGTPALMMLHGWGASGEGMLRARSMVDAALDRGYAVIAPDGIPRANGRGLSWAFHPDRPGPRDEIAFLQSVRDDAADRFGIAPGSILLAGFSIGGSMTAYAACAAPDAFTGYAPLGGNFWHPLSDTCAGPAAMLHVHGWRNGTVPLEGRILRGGSMEDPDVVAQGNVWAAMEIWRATNDCPDLQPRAFPETEGFWRRAWEGCAAPLEIALFDGGHSIPLGWTDMALDWFEGLADR